jgi:Leucine-rich repeat (LRR) protein
LLVFKKGYSPELVRSLIEERQLRGLRIFAHLKENRLDSLDFLNEYSFLEVLDLASVDDYDFKFLESLKNLKELTISIEGKNTIDLSHLTNLQRLNLQWRKAKITGLEKCQSLTDMCLVDFKEEDFEKIALLPHLSHLRIKTASIKTLSDIQNFPNLESLSIGNCKSLKSIETIGALTKLRTLVMEQCPQITGYDYIGSLLNLESLQITDCNEIKSIEFIENLPSLKKLMLLGNTIILDANLKPAEKVQEVLYKPNKNYNIKIENKANDTRIQNNLMKIKKLMNQTV